MSHHGSSAPGDPNPLQNDEELRKKMREMNARLLGEFPDGKTGPDDEGALSMAIKTEDGVVKLIFPKPVAWIGFTPEQAAQLGMDLIKQARQAGHLPLVIQF